MKLKLTFLAGAAVGYVLGARAGRDRYDEMKKQADALWHDPRVQEKVGQATEAVKENAPVVGEKLSQAAGEATTAAKEKASEAGAKAKGAAEAGKDKAAEASDKAKNANSGEGDLQQGAESGDYTPRVTKVQNQ
ncbi:MAG: YtxH domain-containing protein [Mobilicoccus sp.]|nr:YtxH domain-containing protein [Mobilicoccus sp.]